MTNCDYLVVGSGLYGAVMARELTEAGKKVLVIEKRNHIAGNCHTVIEGGILRSIYGGHIFHTDSQRIWAYVNRFSDWLPYEHRVKAFYRGKMYSFPPNLETFEQLGVSYGTPESLDRIREVFFDGYSSKQWGRPLSEVPGNTIRRIPIRDNRDDRYFTDKFQGLPKYGYTPMVDEMLRGIPVALEQDYLIDPDRWNAKRVVFTGRVDDLMGRVWGELEYRSLRFEDEWREGDFQGCATVNYTDLSVPYTRILEWKYFWPVESSRTLITREYPSGEGEPYYPINDDRNNELAKRYLDAARQKGILVGGRLGRYRYLDMHMVIGMALEDSRKEIGP